MRSQALEHCVMGFAVLAMLLWLDLVPTAALGKAVMALLVWAAFSTVLVASAGAWIAFARGRGGSRAGSSQRLTRQT